MIRNEEVVRNAMQAIWNECDISRVSEFYADDFEADYPHTNWGSGLDGICALAIQVHKDLPNYKEDIEELINAGDKIIVTLSISGCHPSNGEKISFRDVTIVTLKVNSNYCTAKLNKDVVLNLGDKISLKTSSRLLVFDKNTGKRIKN